MKYNMWNVILYIFSCIFGCSSPMWSNYKGPIFYNLCSCGTNTKDILGEFTMEFTSFYYYLHFLFCHPELVAIFFLDCLIEYVVLDEKLERKRQFSTKMV